MSKMSTGKHLISNIKNIKNVELLNSMNDLKGVFDYICKTYNFNILNKMEHIFSPHGITIVYMLSESHISIHTFPEKNYAAIDLYTCREYPNNDVYIEIQNYIEKIFDSSDNEFTIIER